MPACPFCNHFNRTDAAQCDQCGAALHPAATAGADSSPPPPAPEPGSLEADILALMQGHKKIDAIKLYRQQSGADLKTAKDFVEALAAKHGVAPSTSGCAGVVLLLFLAGAALSGAAWTLAVL
jgi:ribosomal protein L7/L12